MTLIADAYRPPPDSRHATIGFNCMRSEDIAVNQVINPLPARRALLRRCLAATMMAAALISIAAAPRSSVAQPARYALDPDHLAIGFLVDHIGYAKVLGMFRTARGSYSFDEASRTLSDVRIEIEADSVYTNHRKRDEHLRGPDFLNAKEFPRLVFTASEATREGERDFVIAGQLELLGQKRPVTLKARWNKSAEYEIGTFNKPYVMGVSARGSFKRSEYGMNYAVDNGWVGDEIEMIIEFEAKRQ